MIPLAAVTDSAVQNAGPARGRLDDIRRALAATADPASRGRIRARLADALVACGDLSAAAAELKQAAAEAPRSVALMFGVRTLAARLTPAEADALLDAVDGEQATATPAGRRRLAGRRGPGADVTAELPHDDTQPILIPLPAPAKFVAAPEPAAAGAPDRLDQAFAALAAGKPVWARRLAEDVARARRHDEDAKAGHDRLDRLQRLVEAMAESGARRQALFLSRTLAEIPGDGTVTARAGESLSGLVAKALETNDVELALRWGADLGRPLAKISRSEARSFVGPRDSFEKRFRGAQAALAVLQSDRERAAAIDPLLPLLSGTFAGTAALALALRVAARGAATGEGVPVRPAELWRTALDQETTARGRARLGRRWVDELEADPAAPLIADSLARLEQAIAELPPVETGSLRRQRAELLRRRGRDAELARALEADAAIASGAARAALLAEQATLLENLSQPDRALELRLGALEDSPGELELLEPARRRLEAMGHGERSLDLVLVALPYITERRARVSALRDIATLAETAAEDRARAVVAWLELLTLEPDDGAAFDAAERLLRALGEQQRLGELLAWGAARSQSRGQGEDDQAARLAVLWRLAEHRRQEGRFPAALGHYREIVEARGRRKEDASFGEEWRWRDNRLAVETARTLAAPDAEARARALSDRALVLISAGKLDDAERDLTAAFDLGPATSDVLAALEKLYERRDDWRGLRQRLQSRVGAAAGPVAAKIWSAVGRASERLGDVFVAEFAFTQVRGADETDRAPLMALRWLAAARRDWPAVSALLEKEIERVRGSERVDLLVEQGLLLADKLGRPERAVEVLDVALGYQATSRPALEAMFNAALAAGAWEKAGQSLEALLSTATVPDAAERYHRVGRAAEDGGKIDRALGFYSRAYARNPSYRPSLERLSEICFDRQQWDNAWKATEHLLDRHGADLAPSYKAELALRSALADLHLAQRVVAAARVATMPGVPSSGAGLRDVADSWASMRFDPHLLAGVDAERRGRVLSRLKEISVLTEHDAHHPAREAARETWAALAMVDRRFVDAVEALDAFAADDTLEPRRRALFAVTAGDILLNEQGDLTGAGLYYARARALNPTEQRLTRTGVAQVADESAEEAKPNTPPSNQP